VVAHPALQETLLPALWTAFATLCEDAIARMSAQPAHVSEAVAVWLSVCERAEHAGAGAREIAGEGGEHRG
jgi:hypothetical protein